MFKNKRKQIKVTPYSLVLTIALVLVLGVVVTVRAEGNPLEDALGGLSACAKADPNNKVCSVLANLAEIVLGEQALGGTVDRSTVRDQASNFNALGLISGGGNTVVGKCETVTLPNASSTVYTLTNRSLNDLEVYYTDLWINKAPTATVAFTAGTSTVSATAFDELARLGTSSVVDGLINRFVVATDTMADAHIRNTRLVTSTVAQATAENLASSTAFACGNGSSVTGAGCRVGKSPDSSITVEPNAYLLVHLESIDKRWAVTTTRSTSTPSTDPLDVRRLTEGDIGLRATWTACWRILSTSTPQ